MEKARTVETATVSTLVEVTPGLLREMANQLELTSARATATDTVLIRFTDRITLAYQPSVKPSEQIKEKLKSIEPRTPNSSSGPAVQSAPLAQRETAPAIQ